MLKEWSPSTFVDGFRTRRGSESTRRTWLTHRLRSTAWLGRPTQIGVEERNAGMDVLSDANRGGWANGPKNMEEMEKPRNDTRRTGFWRSSVTVRDHLPFRSELRRPISEHNPTQGCDMELR
jgi:hypothetical protein